MVRRVAVMGVIVEKEDTVERLNALLHDFREYIIGRMGIPYRARGINIISIFLLCSRPAAEYCGPVWRMHPQ